MSNLKEFYKVDALQHEIAFLKKERDKYKSAAYDNKADAQSFHDEIDELKKQLAAIKTINGTMKKQLEIKPKQAYESMKNREFLEKPENQI